jgi:hypothetical protein
MAKETKKKKAKGNRSKQPKGGANTKRKIRTITKNIKDSWDRSWQLEEEQDELLFSIGQKLIKLESLLEKENMDFSSYIEKKLPSIKLKTVNLLIKAALHGTWQDA